MHDLGSSPDAACIAMAGPVTEFGTAVIIPPYFYLFIYYIYYYWHLIIIYYIYFFFCFVYTFKIKGEVTNYDSTSHDDRVIRVKGNKSFLVLPAYFIKMFTFRFTNKLVSTRQDSIC